MHFPVTPPPDAIEPQAVAGQPAPQCPLETDHFCEACGYNLHGQIVTRDPRLGILICRCPECGRHHAAGTGTSAARIWLKRLGTFLLVAWVLFVVAAALVGTAVLGAIQSAHLYSYTESTWINVDRPPAPRERYVVAYGTRLTEVRVARREVRRPPVVELRRPYGDIEFHDMYYSNYPGPDPARLLSAGSAVTAFGLGVFVAVALWHVRRSRQWWALSAPALAGAAALSLWCYWPESEGTRGWAAWRVGGYVLLQSVFLGLGLYYGRPLARAVVRTIVPPRPCQLLTFLWTADGKPPPEVREA
jgi:hypothetical protein